MPRKIKRSLNPEEVRSFVDRYVSSLKDKELPEVDEVLERFGHELKKYDKKTAKTIGKELFIRAVNEGDNATYSLLLAFVQHRSSDRKNLVPLIIQHAKDLAHHSSIEDNWYAHELVKYVLKHFPEIRPYLIPHIAYHAFVEDSWRAYDLLWYSLEHLPSIRPHVLKHATYHAFVEGNEAALGLLSRSLEDFPSTHPYLTSLVIQHAQNITHNTFIKGNQSILGFLKDSLQHLPSTRPHLLKHIAQLAFVEDNKAARDFFWNYLEELPDAHQYIRDPLLQHLDKIVHLAFIKGDQSALEFLESSSEYLPGIHPHLARLLSSLEPKEMMSLFSIKKYISLLYRLKNHIEDSNELIGRAMEEVYRRKFGSEPPEPGHPKDLPQEIEHPAFRNTRELRGERYLEVPEELLTELKSLGMSVRNIYDLHNVLDLIKNHRDLLIGNLTKDLPEENKRERLKEINNKLDELEKKVREIVNRLGTRQVILDFRLRAVPKEPLEWVGARIKASNDCTVPSSPYRGFEEHTVPTFFSKYATTYKILATHIGPRKTRSGEVKDIRVRKNRHVGNVYVTVHHTTDGKKILYLHGVQLGNVYRGVENVGIAAGLLKGVIDTAKESGFDEVWIQTHDLSNFDSLHRALIDEFKKLGAESVTKEELEKLHYHDLPKYYASPHRIGGGKLLKLRLKE